MDTMDDSMLPTSRFWGLVLQPGKRYEQTSQIDFHISMATMDLSKAKDKSHSQVSIEVDGQTYIICSLTKSSCIQQPLDLLFDAGDKLAFSVSGDAAQPVHLTGYYTMSEEADDDMDDMLGEEESSEDEEESVPSLVPVKNGVAKSQKNGKALKGSGDGAHVNGDVSKSGTKRKQETSPQKSAKISKLSDLVDDMAEDESDDEDYECVEEGEGDDDDMDDEEDEEVEEGFSDDDNEDDGDDDDDEAMEEEEDSDMDDETESPFNKSEMKENGKSASKSDQTKKSEVKETANKKKQKNTPAEKIGETKGAKGVKKTINGGVMIEDLIVGNGPVAKSGRPVTVYYRGVLKQNNKQFDATTSGPGFKFRLGAGDVIKGWDRGVEGMCVGGKRRITCPPPMAYGKRGSPPVIPPNSTLVFEVTLKNVQ